MKKPVFFVLFLFLGISSLLAQRPPTHSDDLVITTARGADPAVIKMEFPLTDALLLPDGTIQMGAAVRCMVKNIGSKDYFPTIPSPLKAFLFERRPGLAWKQVLDKDLGVLSAGEVEQIDYYTTYIKGVVSGAKAKPAEFKLIITAKNAGVPNPDVNMNNNALTKLFPF